MKEALLELLAEKPMAKISVTDICKVADVNRSTFYAYYQEIPELLREIEDEVLSHIPIALDPAQIVTNEQFIGELEKFFDYAKANGNTFRVLMFRSEEERFSSQLVKMVFDYCRIKNNIEDHILVKYAYAYCIHGAVAIVKEWIKDGFPVSSHDFAEAIMKMAVLVTDEMRSCGADGQ